MTEATGQGDTPAGDGQPEPITITAAEHAEFMGLRAEVHGWRAFGKTQDVDAKSIGENILWKLDADGVPSEAVYNAPAGSSPKQDSPTTAEKQAEQTAANAEQAQERAASRRTGGIPPVQTYTPQRQEEGGLPVTRSRSGAIHKQIGPLMNDGNPFEE